MAAKNVLQAPIKKKRFIHQRNIPAPSIVWVTEAKELEYNHKMLNAGFLGNITIATVQPQDSKKHYIALKVPINAQKLVYTGPGGICGIASIHKNTVCIAHYSEPHIWVYNDAGQFKEKINIPGIDMVFGMVVTDQRQGKLALVDHTQIKVHFVQLSCDLKILSQSSTDVPMVAERLTIGSKKKLVVTNSKGKKVVVLNTCGEILTSATVHITRKFRLRSALPTASGFVLCDGDNRNVTFVTPLSQ